MARPRPGLLLLFALCAAAFVASAPASLAAVQVAYRCDVDICLLDPDAPSTVTNLTDNGLTSLDETPVWSPDGNRIAFVSTFGNGARNIFVMTPDAPGQSINLATQVTQYPHTGSYVENPVWSPDGTRIAFEQEPNINGPFGIYVAAADGTTAQPVDDHDERRPPHMVAGQHQDRVLQGRAGLHRQLRRQHRHPGHARERRGARPIWSPDGTRIAFDGINAQERDPFVDLHVVSATGGGTPVITPIHYTQWTFAAWSADGHPASPTGRRPTTTATSAWSAPTAATTSGWRPWPRRTTTRPSWSPDGTRVVFHGYHYSPMDSNAHTDEIYMASTAPAPAPRSR